MPAKIHPSDWDVLFAPNAPRRGGPLRALVNIVVLSVVVTVAVFGTMYVLAQRDAQAKRAIANASAVAATVQPQQTATAVAVAAATATHQAERAATAVAQPTSAPAPAILGIGAVNRGGNLRSDTRIADDTVVGLIWPGDQIEFLEQRDVDGQPWYRIRITALAPNRGGDGVPVGSEGWASASLLSPVAQPQP
jgi:hypothetical protein